jgi:malate dehydrogenase (oxaloacetate-decarboxylating)
MSPTAGAHTVGAMSHPSASFSATLRVRLENAPGAFACVAQAIGEANGLLDAIDLVRIERGTKVRDITVLAEDSAHIERIAVAVQALPGVEVEHVSDRTFLLHLGGKLEVRAKAPLKTRDDLSMAYTPGVARICEAIAKEPDDVWNLTVKRNAVAIVSDGTAVLGLGDIGPEAAIPVMEGKAILFKEFAGIDAWPLCLATKHPDEIVSATTAIAPVFGGINLEDISAPRCFEIERRLDEALDIPVFHDDQHGTAIVVLAALLNALRVVGKDPEAVRVVITGVGAAGVATTDILLAAGIRDVVGCDRGGALHVGRSDLNSVKAAYAGRTNPRRIRGTADEALAGADVFIGLSGPRAVSPAAVATMAPDRIVFAMANPTPEVLPEDVQGIAAVIATGRSDYPNQINNVLAFPGVFRGALDVRASTITKEMKFAAAHAIASVIPEDELDPDYIIPSVFNPEVAPAVAAATAEAAEREGVARKARTAATGSSVTMPRA